MPTFTAKKLRMQEAQRALILNAPQGYVASLVGLPEGVTLFDAPAGKHDFVHLFARDSAQLRELSPIAIDALEYDGVFWISYPKRGAKIESDLSRDALWALMEGTGLRPVTQVSIDEVWSALRFRPSDKVGS